MPSEVGAEIFLQIVCYFMGRILLPIMSFGRVHAEPWDRKRRIRFRWHGVHRRPNGKIVFSDDLTAPVGLLLVVAFVVLGTVMYFSLSA